MLKKHRREVIRLNLSDGTFVVNFKVFHMKQFYPLFPFNRNVKLCLSPVPDTKQSEEDCKLDSVRTSTMNLPTIQTHLTVAHG